MGSPDHNGQLVHHDASSELRQIPTAEEWWQDSAFVTWHAREGGIGGVFRIGHEPNHAGGIAALWFGLVTRDGTRFRRNTTNMLGPGDRRAEAFGALDGRYQIAYDGALRYR